MDSNITVEELIDIKFDSLTKGEKKVARYVIDNYVDVLLQSSSELANSVGVGNTTVIRFAKDLGFDGFAELKKEMKANINTANSVIHYMKQMETKRAKSNPIGGYFERTLKDIEGFAETVDYGLFEKAAALILKADTVYTVGVGTDAIIARYLSIYLKKMGFKVQSILEGSVTLWDELLNISKNDVIILSSFPRYIREEMHVADIASEKGIPFIIFTDSESMGMIYKSDITFSVKESEKTFINSLAYPGMMAELLLLTIYNLAPEKISKNLEYYQKFSKPGWE